MAATASTSTSTRAIAGRVHSIETCGTVDGPGIRFVLFAQGCLLRCQYCHNPDSRVIESGWEMTVDEVMAEIEKYRSYMTCSDGGVTISGGEPLLQPEFVGEVFRRCRERGIHTALDTSGYPKFEAAKRVVEHVDLVLLDIKSFDPELYHRVTSVALAPTLRFARYLEEIGKPTWIRFVLVPGLTDVPENVEAIARFAAGLTCVELVEVLPFHQMGRSKWEELGETYPLRDTPPATEEQKRWAEDIFRRHGLQVHSDR